jgi:exopolyphosphatase/guanosine-5'-triphosphate,3'-diphosphate pyrophosphatase
VNSLVDRLSGMSLDKRKKVDGLSRDRADIIVPGLLILRRIFEAISGSCYIVSGSGLRDGLYHETVSPHQPVPGNVLESSVRNLLALHPSVPLPHVEQVDRLAMTLFDGMRQPDRLPACSRQYLHAAALLYRIGVTVNFYNYDQHTFYLMANSRIDGLSHREILICAMVSSYKSRSRTRHLYLQHRDILSEEDLYLAIRLGVLLKLAVALDRSETQPVNVGLRIKKNVLELQLHCSRMPVIELHEVRAFSREFKKTWNLVPKCRTELQTSINEQQQQN